ncbi:hypothetical protein ACFFJY_02880 [Fictibacillus aquaticus]|uniref:Uncharacterized protein n=1 Tax=Fictibacillus aquaticus TaxID=2021314 RepID=A0A235F9F0_9BACL|nr:hypothetical protein [Fictibacillus aquaticus]OYD57643.1 hypothetical protein CGZ90_13340 [Fictibacillus aquaticus]
MGYTLITLLIAGLVLLIDRRKLKQYKRKRENRVYFSIFMIGLVMLLIKSAGIEMPSPLNGISYVLKPLTKMM